MNMEDVLGIIIPSFVSIIGFAISLIILKKGYQNDIKMEQSRYMKEKLNNVLELIDDCIASVFNDVEKNEQNGITEKTQTKIFEIESKIYSYGSLETIKIISRIGEYRNEKKQGYLFFLVVNLILLMSQIRYDITKDKVNPEYWLKMKIENYSNSKEKAKSIINQTIEELNLLEDFKI